MQKKSVDSHRFSRVMHAVRLFSSVLCIATGLFSQSAGAADKPAWKPGQTLPYGDGKVTISQPHLVARSKGYLWFPSLSRLSDGRLLAIMTDYADEHVKISTAQLTWSDDGGLTWTKPVQGRYGDPTLTLENDDEILLPYYLKPIGENVMGEAFQLCKKGEKRAKLMDQKATVSGWTRPDQSFDPTTGVSGFVFNGDTLIDNDKNYLAMLYGHYKDTPRYALVLAESKDGIDWKLRSTIAGEDCPVPGGEGPCEAALCRLADGRLMSIFRVASGSPFGQSFSEDEGKTWSEARAMPGVFSVQPSLEVMANGAVALSGGRPGLYLWLNRDGKGLEWNKFDVLDNHNEFVPAEKITDAGKTSAYTEVVALDEQHLLYIYDRIPHSWSAIPADSKETNSIWVVRVTIEK
ncbi:MAG: sialidase family protein [Planctomycetaceae bacterium]